jgi:hypothetical protein
MSVEEMQEQLKQSCAGAKLAANLAMQAAQQASSMAAASARDLAWAWLNVSIDAYSLARGHTNAAVSLSVDDPLTTQCAYYAGLAEKASEGARNAIKGY